MARPLAATARKNVYGIGGWNSLRSHGCLILYFARLYDAYLMNMLTVQIDFVSRRHIRPVDVGGGPNGFGKPRVLRVFEHVTAALFER